MPGLADAVTVLVGIAAAGLLWAANLFTEFIGFWLQRTQAPGFLTVFFGNWVGDIGSSIQARMAGGLDNALPGVASIVAAPAGALDTLLAPITQALWNHRVWSRDIVDNQIPRARAFAQAYTDWRYTEEETHINEVDVFLTGYIQQVQAYLINFVNTTAYYVYQRINQVGEALYQYILSVQHSLTVYIGQVERSLTDYADKLYNDATAYTTRAWVALAAAIVAASAALTSYITSVSTFITTEYIPAALAAYTETIVAQIALSMDELWPGVFRSLAASAVKILTSAPTVAARVVAVPPEPVPGIGGAFEATTGALGYLAAMADGCVAPLWTKLHDFADEEAELTSPLTDVALFGAITAMVVTPQVSADTLDTVLSDTLVPVVRVATDLLATV